MQADLVARLDVAYHHDEGSLDIVADLLGAVDADGHILGVVAGGEISHRRTVAGSYIVKLV